MGAGESTEKLGQRVLIAKAKFEGDLKSATQRYDYLQQKSPDTLTTMIESVGDSFATCSPFLQSTLLIAWLFDADKCKETVLKACKKVLRAPIDASDYDWFKNYVFTSNIWMQKDAKSGKFMYQELLAIGNEMSSDIIGNMDSIFTHLESHKQWDKVMAIKNESLISRQDHKSVGLLTENGLSQVFEMKSDDENGEDMKNFIDSNMAINMLTSTASKLNGEFQRHTKLVMSAHGNFKEAPMKKVERSVSKCENDYNNERFPKAAKLLDMVRCSVTFNTVEQLIRGYHAFLNHIKANPTIIELSRVKNGFLNKEGGYRDIKVNVVYKSQNPDHQNVRMVCEVQLLLINYLEEKKKIHKLYSILREETFFKMVVSEQPEKGGPAKDIKELQFKETLDVRNDVQLSGGSNLFKSSVDSELGLLAIEAANWFGVVDMSSKKEIWKFERTTSLDPYGGAFGLQTHEWIVMGKQKYLSVQTDRNKIKMFKVEAASQSFTEDAKYELTYTSNKGDKATINFCDFDYNFEHIFLVADNNILEKRAVRDINTVVQSIELEESVKGSFHRNFRLSADGKFCVVTGGYEKKNFCVVDIENGKQIQFKSGKLNGAYVPCFISGANEFVAVSDQRGLTEIWDVEKKQVVKTLNVSNQWIRSSASRHNILATGAGDNTLRLYDVRTWECFHSKKFKFMARSLHLTGDLKYLSYAGGSGTVILEIQ